jgi:two-component system CheB/CheR fusion protein
MLPRLFEPFAQAESGIERSKGGLGLGLALVKTLAQMHGGSVAASSPGLGRGARFTLTLPTTPEPAATGSPEDAALPAQRRRILVIEDNKDAAESLQTVLESSGHLVTVAYDGTGGVISARANPPDVVLCDIGLPGMDGFAVARALSSSPELKVTRLYALTGYASADDVRRAKEAGFAALIPKPASESQLADAVAGRI